MEDLSHIPIALVEDPDVWPACADQLEMSGLHRDAEGLRLTDTLPFPMVWCPPGEFKLGSNIHPTSVWDVIRQATLHTTDVVLNHGFWIGKYPVTQSEWTRVMGSNPSRFVPTIANRPLADADAIHLFPVECVSWHDAQAYLSKLTMTELAEGRLPPGWSYMLPTSAQWEYACRAGTDTKFYFGDDDDTCLDHGWVCSNSSMQPHPVGRKSPNPWGLYDLYGNVSEWCQEISPVGESITEPCRYRVTRGGGFDYHQLICGSFRKGAGTSDYRYADVGFRACLCYNPEGNECGAN